MIIACQNPYEGMPDKAVRKRRLSVSKTFLLLLLVISLCCALVAVQQKQHVDQPVDSLDPGAPVIAIGWALHKRALLQLLYPEADIVFLPKRERVCELLPLLKEAAGNSRKIVLFIWGYSEPPGTLEEAKEYFDCNVVRFEDGFVRSVGLGADHYPPFSLVSDPSGSLYFDARYQSGLEKIYNEYDFQGSKELMSEAQRSLEYYLKNSLSKYNPKSPTVDYWPALQSRRSSARRILILGQVPGDASLKFGTFESVSFRRVAESARSLFPDAYIVFRSHPDMSSERTADCLDPTRTKLSQTVLCVKVRENLDDISHIQNLVNEVDYKSSTRAMTTWADEVFVITSLAGFEAVLLGKNVYVFGCPFYCGWGVTKDIGVCKTRRRKLSELELFAGAYLLYPSYFDPSNGLKMKLTDVMQRIVQERSSSTTLVI